MEVLLQIVNLSPSDANVWVRLGVARFLAEQRSAAVTALERAVEIDPKMAIAWQRLFLVYLMLERPGDAAKAFNMLSDLDPNLARDTLDQSG